MKRPDDTARENAREPPEPLLSRRTSLGVVKWCRDDKGYGAIATADTAPWDIWFHFTTVESPRITALIPGEHVEVEYIRTNQESFKYVAQRVHRVGDPLV
jgi:cold shock CspA family protein